MQSHRSACHRKRKSSKKQQPPITQHVLPLLKKPMEHIGKQIDVPGSYWESPWLEREQMVQYS